MQQKTRPPGRIKSAILGWLGVPIGVVDGSMWQHMVARSESGNVVTAGTALQLSAVWRCVRLISETISTLPLNIYRADGAARVVDKEHQLYRLLHHQPNADMTAVVFWQCVLSSMLLWGNAYVEVRRSGQRITSLGFLLPQAVSMRRLETGAIEWKYLDPITKTERVIPESAMWHTPAFTADGVLGISPIAAGANVFGAAIAAESAAAKTFKNGLKSAGIVTMNASLKGAQRDEMRQHVQSVNAAGGVMVLEKGSDFRQLTMNPQDAELLKTREFGVEEVARWFGVPPHMIGHTTNSTSYGTGIESQMTAFVMFSLRSWCVRIEQAIRKSLMTPQERDQYNAEFVVEGLLRGDSDARSNYYSRMVQNGMMTRNEVRRLENMPPIAGGDELTVQSNMIPMHLLGTMTSRAQPTEAENARDAD